MKSYLLSSPSTYILYLPLSILLHIKGTSLHSPDIQASLARLLCLHPDPFPPPIHLKTQVPRRLSLLSSRRLKRQRRLQRRVGI